MRISRRSFLRGSAAALGTLAVSCGGLANRNAVTRRAIGYGSLKPVADLRDGRFRLALPDGFSYRTVSVSGERMSDDNLTPLAPDGMAAFALPNGNIRIIRNHEDRNQPGAGSCGGSIARRYDPKAGGGATSLEVNPVSRELVRDFLSLNGTTVNCSGGPTPWGSWLSCEETLVGPPLWDKEHGYVFEVPVLASTTVQAVPLKALGRFLHEAVAIDPATGTAYETEDNGPSSGFYRFLPQIAGDLRTGRLQMLKVRGHAKYDTASGQKVGMPLAADWVDIALPDPASRGKTVFEQGYEQGAARFSRLEGAWFGEGSVFFNSTNGGDAHLGQVWSFRPEDGSGGQLTLLFESGDASVLDSPDHICVTPRGGIVLCEDGAGDQYLRGLTQQGEIFDFALNLSNSSEWAGATFSPDGQTLFVNRLGVATGPNPPPDDPGMTFAIWGPWGSGLL
ncbi:MAG TPA: alkaline phosphatase PhoX [Dehalococcoidia bacterium]|nr:alkaline phosphatase PhoX [Dehalococcoidia bacterium]